MSIRTLFEINHDYSVRNQDGLLVALQRYLNSGDHRAAEELERYGIKVIASRHHSTEYWVRPETDGFPVKYLASPPRDEG